MLEVVLSNTLGAEARDVLEHPSVKAELSVVPEDARMPDPGPDHRSGFRRSSQDVNELFVKSAYSVATAIGRTVGTSAQMRPLLGPCASAATTEPGVNACVREFVSRFGRISLRRVLSADDIDFYAKLHPSKASIDAASVGQIVATMLTAPDALYQIEDGAAELPGTLARRWLSPVEFANRLTLSMWNAPPTQELIEVVDGTSELDKASVDMLVERVLEDDRFDASAFELAQDWMRVTELAPLDALNDNLDFRAFAGKQAPSSILHSDMKQEVGDFLVYMVRNGMTVRDLLTRSVSFARSPELANLYGVEPWQPGSPPVPVDGRPGIFTRAGTLASGHKNSSPILRGVFLRRALLCMDVPAPPPSVADDLPLVEPDESESTRSAVERITSQSPSCQGCHETFINGLGFALEGFDALGRKRAEERVFDAMGRELAVHPIDKAAIPRVLVDDETPVASAAELAQRMHESGMPGRCLAQSMIRFSLFVGASENSHGCLMERVRQNLERGSMRDAFASLLRSPEFRQRSWID